jgi:hypothetical protein
MKELENEIKVLKNNKNTKIINNITNNLTNNNLINNNNIININNIGTENINDIIDYINNKIDYNYLLQNNNIIQKFILNDDKIMYNELFNEIKNSLIKMKIKY